MQKTRLGITAGLFGAAIYFTGLFSGYIVLILMVGYVLLFEENGWLRRSAVKAVVLMMMISLLTMFINLVPNIISFMNEFVGIFGGHFSVSFLSKLASAIVSFIGITEKILFMILGIKALSQETVVISFVDKFIDKYMG